MCARLPGLLFAPGHRRGRARHRSCAATRIIRSRADFYAARWRSTWSANTHRSACCIRSGASGAKGEGRFERISWDEALDTIAARLQAVARRVRARSDPALQLRRHHGSNGAAWTAASSTGWAHRGSTAPSARPPGWRGTDAGARHSLRAPSRSSSATRKLILAWGANILGTNVHLWPFIMEARRNGAKLYTIDPRRNRTGAAIDRHYFINPAATRRWRSRMMHVIIGEKLHDADYVEQLHRRLRRTARARAARGLRSAPRS